MRLLFAILELPASLLLRFGALRFIPHTYIIQGPGSTCSDTVSVDIVYIMDAAVVTVLGGRTGRRQEGASEMYEFTFEEYCKFCHYFFLNLIFSNNE